MARDIEAPRNSGGQRRAKEAKRDPSQPMMGYSQAQWDRLMKNSEKGARKVQGRLEKKVREGAYTTKFLRSKEGRDALNVPMSSAKGRMIKLGFLRGELQKAKEKAANSPGQQMRERSARAKAKEHSNVFRQKLGRGNEPAISGQRGKAPVRGPSKQKPLYTRGSNPAMAVRYDATKSHFTDLETMKAADAFRTQEHRRQSSKDAKWMRDMDRAARPGMENYVFDPKTETWRIRTDYKGPQLPKALTSLKKKQDSSRRGMLKVGDAEITIRKAHIALRSGYGNLMVAQGATNVRHTDIRDRISKHMVELDKLSKDAKFEAKREEIQWLRHSLSRQHDEAVRHIKAADSKAAERMSHKEAIEFRADTRGHREATSSIRASEHIVERHMQGTMTPEGLGYRAPVGAAAIGISQEQLAQQYLESNRRFGSKIVAPLSTSAPSQRIVAALAAPRQDAMGPHRAASQIFKDSGFRPIEIGHGASKAYATVNVLHPGFSTMVRRLEGYDSNDRSARLMISGELHKIQRHGIRLSEQLGLPIGHVPANLISNFGSLLGRTPHQMTTPREFTQDQLAKSLGSKKLAAQVHAKLAGKPALFLGHSNIKDADIDRLITAGDLAVDFRKQSPIILHNLSTMPVEGKHVAGERISHGVHGGGRNIYTAMSPAQAGSVSPLKELAEASQIHSQSYARMQVRDPDQHTRLEIGRKSRGALGELGGSRIPTSPYLFTRSMLRGFKEKAAYGEIHYETTATGRRSYLQRVRAPSRTSIPMNAAARGLRMPPGLTRTRISKDLWAGTPGQIRRRGGPLFSPAFTGSPSIEQGGFGPAVDSRRTSFAKIPPHRSERTYISNVMAVEIVDESNLEKLQNNMVRILDDAADGLTARMYHASMDVLGRRGIEPRWAPNAAFTKMRKGRDSPGLESGALARGLKVVSQKNEVAKVGSMMLTRELGWDQTPHPVDPLDNRTTDDKPFTMAGLASLNEFGGSHGEKADGTPFIIPSRPWLSRAADLFGNRALDATAKDLGARIEAYGFTATISSAFSIRQSTGKAVGIVSSQKPSSAFAIIKGEAGALGGEIAESVYFGG